MAARWGGKNKKCHLSGNAEVVPVSEPSKKVVPLFEREKRSCQYLIITLKVVPLYDVYPYFLSVKINRQKSQRRWTAPLHHVQLVQSTSRQERIREIIEG